jgi:hypothetical protein
LAASERTFPIIREVAEEYANGLIRKINLVRRVFLMIEAETETNKMALVKEREQFTFELQDLSSLEAKMTNLLKKLRTIKKNGTGVWNQYVHPMQFIEDQPIVEGYVGEEFLTDSIVQCEAFIHALERDRKEVKRRLDTVKADLIHKGHWLDSTKDCFHFLVRTIVQQKSVQYAIEQVARIVLESGLRKADYHKGKNTATRRSVNRQFTVHERGLADEDLKREAVNRLSGEIEQIYKRQRRLHPERYKELPDLDWFLTLHP